MLDDLQWADQGSLALLGFLISSDAAARVLVIGAFRDSELAQAIALRESLAALGRHSPGSRLELRGLDNAGVVEFMEALAGYELGTDEMNLADAVYRETDGNPFYVNQVLRHLVDTSAIVQDMSGRWVARGSFEHIDLPSGVREVIGGRVVALGAACRAVLSVAAVIGRDFDLRLLGAAAEIDDDDLIDMLDAAVSSGLVRETADEPGRYYFTHALIQHTLYENLGPTRRARPSAGCGGPRTTVRRTTWPSDRRARASLDQRRRPDDHRQGDRVLQTGGRRGPRGTRTIGRAAALHDGPRPLRTRRVRRCCPRHRPRDRARDGTAPGR